MEKAKLYSKITLCILLIMATTVAIATSLAFGDVRWQSVAVLITAWWSSLFVLGLVLLDIDDIYGFVKRTFQHQLNGPKGYVSKRFFLMLLLLAVFAAAVYMYGSYYVALVQYGSNVEAITTGAITMLLLAVAKTYGYHRYDTKRVKTDSREYVAVDSLLV